MAYIETLFGHQDHIPHSNMFALGLEELSPNGLPQPKNYRFLRVPNHDHIEVTPGVRDVMIACRENDPLFGRPHENEEEIKMNWTKVYIPKYFKPRIRLLVLWHQITALSISGGFTIVPLILGRILSINLESFLEKTFSVVIPKDLQGTTILQSGRFDLVCHDIYSILLGAFTIAAVCLPFYVTYVWTYNLFCRLKRRNAVRRRTNSGINNQLRGYEGIFDDDEENDLESLSWPRKMQLNITTWWLMRGRKYLERTIAFITLVFWTGLVIPTLFGFAFEIYVLHPLGIPAGHQPIYFILTEWGFGMLLVKLSCTILLAGPDSFMKREINSILTRGLNYDILGFYRHIIMPLLAILSFSILIPKSFSNILTDLETQEEKENLTLYLKYFLMISIFAKFTFRTVYRGISQFLESVRDEQFKIGRVLHNYDDSHANSVNNVVES